jgi:hypothetical protein
MAKEEFMQTFRPDGKKGIWIRKRTYEQLSSFILEAVERDTEITMNALLNKEHPGFPGIEDKDVAWHILQVKLDLEARGLLKVYIPIHRKRLFHLKLTRLGARQVRERKSLTSSPFKI